VVWNPTLAVLWLNTFFLEIVLESSRWVGSTRFSQERWRSPRPVEDELDYSLLFPFAAWASLNSTLPPLIPHLGMWRYYTTIIASQPFILVVRERFYYLWRWTTPSSPMLRGIYRAEVAPIVGLILNMVWALLLFIFPRTSTTSIGRAVVSYLFGAVMVLLQLLELWRWVGYELRMVGGWLHFRMRACEGEDETKTE